MNDSTYKIIDMEFWADFTEKNFEGTYHDPIFRFEDRSRTIHEDISNLKSHHISIINRPTICTYKFDGVHQSERLIKETYDFMTSHGFMPVLFDSTIIARYSCKYDLFIEDEMIYVYHVRRHVDREVDSDKRQTITQYLKNNKFVKRIC